MALYNDGWSIRATSLGNPVPAVPTTAFDTTVGVAFHVDFEILTGWAGPAQIEFWAYPDLPGSNGCLPDMANGVLITEGALCDFLGLSIVGAAVNFPVTLQVGDHVWARPRCMPDGMKWLGIVGKSGDFAHISAVGVNSRRRGS